MTAPKKHSRSASTDDVLKHPSTKRAKEIDQHTPYSQLADVLESTASSSSSSSAANVLHWFRSKDLRIQDNRGLHAASIKAKETKGKLITMFLYSPKDIEWHGASPARIDFMLQSLSLLQKELEEDKNIPLAIVSAEKRGEKSDKLLHFLRDNDIGHVTGCFEYEVDELRRDIDVAEKLKEEGVAFELLHDQTVVEPGTVLTGSGGPQKVFTPYHKAWLGLEEVQDLEEVPEPEGNSDKKGIESLFGSEVPAAPKSKTFKSDEEKKKIRKLWPAGTKAGMERLDGFLKDKVKSYAAHRSEPALDPSSRLSPYFASGVVSVRSVLSRAKKANSNKSFDSSGDAGIAAWVREIVFREFYRQVLVITPHSAMNLPQNLKFDFVQWEDDEEGYKKWEDGKTGMPFIDAGMRQLKEEAYMHNRLRMNVSSYLRANLLVDYRRGERYFAETLIDWDLANNTQGWEPSYTVFNPVVQAEKCDKNGDYIRKWVPELSGLQGKDIFDPYNRLSKSEFEKLSYPKPHVDFHESSQRAKARYKQDLAEADP